MHSWPSTDFSRITYKSTVTSDRQLLSQNANNPISRYHINHITTFKENCFCSLLHNWYAMVTNFNYTYTFCFTQINRLSFIRNGPQLMWNSKERPTDDVHSMLTKNFTSRMRPTSLAECAIYHTALWTSHHQQAGLFEQYLVRLQGISTCNVCIPASMMAQSPPLSRLTPCLTICHPWTVHSADSQLSSITAHLPSLHFSLLVNKTSYPSRTLISLWQL